ncbi:Rv3235 family protein [Actinomadura soli]|uniref:Rv3235 family protein n=1 Tax=Actinomadura soli TaxID=2508997 RepID=UPI0014873289|nr:Rv3235 family protein [Actinomadura soli]
MRGRTGKSAVVRFVRYRPVPATQGALALKPAAPPPVRPPGLRLVRPDDGMDAEVRAVANATVRLVAEILAGTRPPHQLSLVAVPAVCRALLHHLQATGHTTPAGPGKTTEHGTPTRRDAPGRRGIPAERGGPGGLGGAVGRGGAVGPGGAVGRGGAVGAGGRAVGRGGRVVPPKVLSSRLQRPAPAVAETVAVVVVAGRVHALALRLEHTRGRWRCTALETTAP